MSASTTLESLQTPALLVRLDRVRANLARMRELLAPHGGFERWRPHVKTAKTPSVQNLLLDSGLRQFKCATTREARVLLELAQARSVSIDLCVALALRGANLARLAQLSDEHPRCRLSVLSESAEHARDVRSLAPRLGVWIDVDPRMGRSGVELDDSARLASVRDAAGDALRGLHAYEGHVRHVSPAERSAACEPLFAALAQHMQTPQLHGLELVTSGTPTFEQALAFGPFRALRHRISPGIVVYWDHNSASLGIEGFSVAASVLARVVSATRERVTLDAGSKSLDAAAGDPCVRVRGWPELEALRPSEEHLPLRARDGRVPAAGSLLELEPRHVCPMVNLAERVVLLEGERVLGSEAVAARGHDIESSGSDVDARGTR